MSEPRARDIMTNIVRTFDAELPARAASAILLREHHSGAPVMSGDNDLVGIISEVDLVELMAAVVYDDAPDIPVKDFMTSELVCVEPDTDLTEIVTIMRDKRVRRLPVVSGDQLLGLVSHEDVLRALVELARLKSCT